jgi:hypothetical protein
MCTKLNIMPMSIEQELAVLKFEHQIREINLDQAKELLILMFLADIGKTNSWNELIKHRWFKEK